MPTFRELLSSVRSRVAEVLPAEAAEHLRAEGAVALDVREPDEYEQGALKGAVHIPRGFLEMQVQPLEGRGPSLGKPRSPDP